MLPAESRPDPPSARVAAPQPTSARESAGAANVASAASAASLKRGRIFMRRDRSMAEPWSYPCRACSTEEPHGALPVVASFREMRMTILSKAKYCVGWTWFKVFGWELETEVTTPDKFVLVAAPHTSGWGLPFMLAV